MTDRDTSPSKKPIQCERAINRDSRTPTVASLGIQVRLTPVDPNRERQLASLLAACEILRAECERLFQRIADLIDEDALRGQGRGHSSRSSDL